MKKRTLWFFTILWLWALVLTGCNKADKTPVEDEILTPETEETTLPTDAKTSLTLQDLENIEETNFPKSYSYSRFNMEDNLMEDEWEYTYPEGTSHTLLIPDHATMASREIVTSWIEDGMIYTMSKVTLQDGTSLNVLYINDPVTLNFVAASAENGNVSTNYQFSY